MSRAEGQPVSFKAKAMTLIALTGASLGVIRCANAENHQDPTRPNKPIATKCIDIKSTVTSGEACVGFNPTSVDVTLTAPATATLAPEATTPEVRALTFDEISTKVAEAYQTIQIPVGLCDISLMDYMISEAKNYRANFDEVNGDFTPYSSRYGALIEEIQKIADATDSEVFANLQKELERSLTDDVRAIVVKRGGTEENVQSVLSTWRANWLDRNGGGLNYDASRSQIVLPK